MDPDRVNTKIKFTQHSKWVLDFVCWLLFRLNAKLCVITFVYFLSQKLTGFFTANCLNCRAPLFSLMSCFKIHFSGLFLLGYEFKLYVLGWNFTTFDDLELKLSSLLYLTALSVLFFFSKKVYSLFI